jgi:hypothetical protein
MAQRLRGARRISGASPSRLNSDALAGPLMRLRLAQFGGWSISPQESEAQLKACGFQEAKVLPGPPTSPAIMIAGRK